MHWLLVGRERLLESVLDAVQQAPGGALLDGEMGVGKTRVAITVSKTLQERGWHVERTFASQAATPIPFGALSRLVPRLPAADLMLMLEHARHAIVKRAAGRRLLFFVDDAHRLDPGSLALVHRLAVTSEAAVLLTRRMASR